VVLEASVVNLLVMCLNSPGGNKGLDLDQRTKVRLSIILPGEGVGGTLVARASNRLGKTPESVQRRPSLVRDDTIIIT
jgi:hypothetical protein